MKKIITVFGLAGALLLLSVSCSAPIIGATKHLKDKDCGCYCPVPVQSPDSVYFLTQRQ